MTRKPRRMKDPSTAAERSEVRVDWGDRKERLLLALSAEEKIMLRVLSEAKGRPMAVVLRTLLHDEYGKFKESQPVKRVFRSKAS